MAQMATTKQTFTKGHFLICLEDEGLGLDGIGGLTSKILNMRLNR